MKIIVKKLQGEECSLDVNPDTFVLDIKKEVSKQLGISVDQQKLLFLGKTLADELTVQSYPTIKEGTKLNLVVKKPDGLLEVAVKHFKKSGMTDLDSKKAANDLLNIVQQKFNALSWDDIERLSKSCMGKRIIDCDRF